MLQEDILLGRKNRAESALGSHPERDGILNIAVFCNHHGGQAA